MTSSRKTFGVPQNPAPTTNKGQEYLSLRQNLTDSILNTFRQVLPSNYVSVTNGPWYTLQFQAIAEQLADIQLTAEQVHQDSTWDFTRTDFLWQSLGSLIFPNGDQIPELEGDLRYRAFLQKMVLLLLEGATRSSMEEGVEALDPSIVATVVERYLQTPPYSQVGGHTLKEQFVADVFIEGFPDTTAATQRNVDLVLSAVKPAHVLYSLGNLFRDAANPIQDSEVPTLDLDSYYYDDHRKWVFGAKSVTGSEGETLTDRTLFTDPNRSFGSIRLGATLEVQSGANAGRYRVIGKRALLSGANATPVRYTLSSGGSGSLVALSADVVQDESRDWGQLGVNDTLTILAGPNAGTYRLDSVTGGSGGPVGNPGVSGTSVKLAPSTLKLDRRMPEVGSSQTYSVVVDRLGVRTPREVLAEDVSNQFFM